MRLSKQKREKIYEQTLALLYHCFPKQLFTAEIARELARDEEFIKKILFELKEKNLVLIIKKTSEGKMYIKRAKWQLTSASFNAYNKINSSI
jgi:predicted chitinase